MLNDEDITKLKSGIATYDQMRNNILSINKFLEDLNTSNHIPTQLSRHELWIKQIAEKVGLKLATD